MYSDNFLELIIGQKHVGFMKDLVSAINHNSSHCKIIFTNYSDNKLSIDLTTLNINKEIQHRIKIQDIEVKYFKCDLSQVQVTVDSILLRNCFQRININDPVIICMEKTKDNLHVYNLDNNNNIY
ncbi:hypothetical protein QKC54_gp0059 [Megavirus baoshan]|uniref:Proliferating cell nuclear antigen n=1 Tax=Megavirus baoshan TaxID=2496520 RepID=A0A3S8UYE8_9VIRU|nr:hypothetical protein QKC54_gp0059 [Megavirus baoshan]AZL89845.1 hypothetical protein Mb1013 [Megavirus baoshan]